MRARPFAGFVVLIALGIGGACAKAPASEEHVTSTTLPPFAICYELDGAPCPLDAGDDGAGAGGELDASEAGPG